MKKLNVVVPLVILALFSCSEDHNQQNIQEKNIRAIQKEIDIELLSLGFNKLNNEGLITYELENTEINIQYIKKVFEDKMISNNWVIEQESINEYESTATNSRDEGCQQFTETFYDGGGCFLDVIFYECDGEFSTLSIHNCYRCWFGATFEGCNTF